MTEIIEKPKHFIEQRIENDLENNTYDGNVVTRFPPEPSGYLHIGHAKSINLNFGMARQYNGVCHLRFDDTNPAKEELEYSESMKEDIKWLGFTWDSLHYASDYFGKLYDAAVELIKQGHAYVDSLSPDEIREHRGTLKEAGKNSPYRDRSVDENLALFSKMKAGEFKEGECVLRAKIDMSSGNINLRDPIMYRILHQDHPHTTEKWCIYPMYDYAHCMSDAIENITHSLCTLEFQDHRPLYDWFLEKLTPAPRPQQIEFSRLNYTHTLTSKRKLKRLVDENIVDGWDDPRMATLVGIRRRGFTPSAILKICNMIGISKSDSTIDFGLVEEAVRDDLNQQAARIMAVLDPLKVTITNLNDDHLEELHVANHPQNPDMGKRVVPFSNVLYIEREDFSENPPKKYRRLALDKEVRLRGSYVMKCNEVIKNDSGEIVELKCSIDLNTLGKNPEDRKVKGVIHWLSKAHAKSCQVRLYDRLFEDENPGSKDSWEDLLACLNPNSLTVLENCYIEAHAVNLAPEDKLQFERTGYFVADRYEFNNENLVFNRIVGLRDSWAKNQK